MNIAIPATADCKSGQGVADKAETILSRFISYPSTQCRDAHVLWILHTHLVQHFETTPRLAFLSPEPASGKTRALEITERLVPNPVATVNVSPSYLFRKVGQGDTTILFDEVDTVFGPKAKDNEDIRGLLNAGYRRGASVGRCVVKGKTIETEEIPAFAPVALAGLGWLPDTILTRSIVVRMQRRAAGEKVEPYRRRLHDVETDRLRDEIAAWSTTVWPEGVAWPDLPAEIQDRDADVWEPLIAIADWIGGDWPSRARDAAVTLVTAGRDREPSIGLRLLADLRDIFGSRTELQTATIITGLLDLDEAPWSEINFGKPVNARYIAKHLQQYGIQPTVIRFGAVPARGYRADDFRVAWERYLPPLPGNSETTVTNVTPIRSRAIVTAVTPVTADEDDSVSRRHKCLHCRQYGETLQIFRGGYKIRLHRECVDAWCHGFDERSGGLSSELDPSEAGS